MAEPPGSEGRVARPPPVPSSRTGGPQAGAPPGVSRGPRSTQRELASPGEESTQRVATLTEFVFIEEVVQLLSTETQSLASSDRGDSETMVADMHLRMALLSWDATEDESGVVHHLERADGHPLTPGMLLAHALSSGSTDR